MATGLARALAVAGTICAAASDGTARELDLDTLLAPVIALEARIPEDAGSAKTLGTLRGGTGVVIDGAGLVLTIGYLILDAEEVELLPRGLGGPRVPADVVAWDHVTGLGLVRSRRALDLSPMTLGDSARLRVDDAVIVVSWTREAGLLPAVVTDRAPYAGYWEYLLEDALYVSPIHPAFPGAALISLQGELVGIGGFAHFDSVDEEEIAGTVFIPIDALKPVLADLLLDGRSPVQRPWLGLYCEEGEDGLRVRRVPADGPAAKAGVLAGDRVIAVADTPVGSLAALYRRLWTSARPGDLVELALQRDGIDFTVEVRAMDRHARGARVPGAP